MQWLSVSILVMGWWASPPLPQHWVISGTLLYCNSTCWGQWCEHNIDWCLSVSNFQFFLVICTQLSESDWHVSVRLRHPSAGARHSVACQFDWVISNNMMSESFLSLLMPCSQDLDWLTQSRSQRNIWVDSAVLLQITFYPSLWYRLFSPF